MIYLFHGLKKIYIKFFNLNMINNICFLEMIFLKFINLHIKVCLKNIHKITSKYVIYFSISMNLNFNIAIDFLPCIDFIFDKLLAECYSCTLNQI